MKTHATSTWVIYSNTFKLYEYYFEAVGFFIRY